MERKQASSQDTSSSAFAKACADRSAFDKASPDISSSSSSNFSSLSSCNLSNFYKTDKILKDQATEDLIRALENQDLDECEKLEYIKYAISNGADVNNVVSFGSRAIIDCYPLYLALVCFPKCILNFKIVKILIDSGVDVNKKFPVCDKSIGNVNLLGIQFPLVFIINIRNKLKKIYENKKIKRIKFKTLLKENLRIIELMLQNTYSKRIKVIAFIEALRIKDVELIALFLKYDASSYLGYSKNDYKIFYKALQLCNSSALYSNLL